MEWLLKITEGPMRGAEIALVNGTRVTLGKGDVCDIVVADASLANEALSLDVAENGVTMVRSDGSCVVLRPFETHAIGTTALAVGPAEGAWEELRPAPTESPAEVPEEPEAPVAAAASPRQDEAESTDSSNASGKSHPQKKSRLGCLFLLLLLVIVALLVFWRWREPILSFCKSFKENPTAPVSAVTCARTSVSLAELASENGLRFSTTNGAVRLSGNLKRRTERHAIRALALAADRYCQLDLSDDESFKSAAEALLFTVTEEAVKVVSAAERQVALKGYAPDAAALERLLEAMQADIPWLEKTDTKGVTVGGPVPEGLSKSRFATTGELSTSEDPVSVAPEAVEKETTNAVATAEVGLETPMSPEDRLAALLVAQAERMNGLLPRAVLPVAGVLTKPYPCVVLANGGRLIEGAKISGLEIVRIEAARIVFGFRDKQVRWEP